MFRNALRGTALRCTFAVLLWVVPTFAQLAPNRYTLLLEDPPVASRFEKREDLQSAAAVAYRTQIEAKQQAVRNELAARRIPVTSSTSILINAIFVTAPASRVPEMLSIPGVIAVRPMHRIKRALNAATQLMNAPAAWNVVGGQSNAGKGIKIAVLDTGIDQTHPAFQDSTLSMPAGYPKCDAYNQPNCSNFTNSKVIVARSYVQMLAGFTSSGSPSPATSTPDDYTPRDRDGHGTAVAAAAAANQNTGPAIAASGGNITFTGMAPKAYLGNYKIYGSPGVNDFYIADDVLIQALTDAMSDGMNIVTISSGSPALTGATDTGAACGLSGNAQCDPLAAAFEAAAEKGLVITAAVGNSGDDAFFDGQNFPYFNSIYSPASAPSVIGVGATINSHALTPAVYVTASGAPANVKGIAAQLSDALFENPGCGTECFPTFGANAAPLVDITQTGNDGYACSAINGSLIGKFALIQRGNCSFATKATNAQAAGAAGIILYDNTSESLASIVPGGMCAFAGPAVIIAQSDGANLKSYIDANAGASVTIDTGGMETPLSTFNSEYAIMPPLAANQLASFSSFGPTPDGLIKPDMVATGGVDAPPVAQNVSELNYGIYTAAQNFDPNGEVYSSNRYAAADGTSFATPLVAGAAALVIQAHPTYTAAQIKSALVNYSASVTADDVGDNVTPEWTGAGLLNAGTAVNAPVGVSPATISFGYLQKTTSLPITKALTVTNQSAAPVTLTVAVVTGVPATGATVAVNNTSLAVPANGSATLNVALSGSVPAAGAYSGQITLQAGNISMTVPYLFLVGSNVAYNVVPYVGGEGIPGADTGASFVQVIDQYGVPVTGQAVQFSAATGSMTFNSVQGEPACSGSGTSAATCNTDNFGFAYADIVLGNTPGTPSITISAAGVPLSSGVTILPQPTISQILDNAAFQPTIAPGSIVAIKGANLMDTAELVNTTQGYDLSTGPFWPISLDGVNVSFDVPGANISVPAPIVAISPGQINVQVPWELAGQTSAQVKVIVDEIVYGSVATATLATYTPAFFTNSGNVADALDTNYNVITASNPAVRGNYIQLYANGLGPVTSTPADGFAPSTTLNTTQTCTVTIGGQSATVGFCGQPQGLAIYQVNVQVPANIGTGNQAVTISVGGQTSPANIVIPVK
jgi:minor extracellular serine protease Vpr